MSKSKLFWAIVQLTFYIGLMVGIVEFMAFLMNFTISEGLGKGRATFGFAGIVILLVPIWVQEIKEHLFIICEPIAIWIVKRREKRK